MLCEIDAKYERNVLIKLGKRFSPFFGLKILIISKIELCITLGTHVVEV